MRAPILALSLLAATATLAAAQARDTMEPLLPPRAFVGGGLVYGSPQGEFGRQIDEGFGLRGHFLYTFDRDGWLALRVDGGGLIYGQERKRVPLSSTVGGRVMVDVTTSNNIGFVGIGPQIGVPAGQFRPYAHGFAGVTFLSTTTSVSGTRNTESDPFASTTNHHDAVFAYGAGTGIYIPLRRGHTPISLDLGLVYHNSGEASYLREGDIEDHPDGSITVHPVRSRTDLLNFHVGVSVGLANRARR
jgi:hypothetical protein